MLSFDMIKAAQQRIEHHAVKTPLLKSHYLDAFLEADIWLKCENLQRTGSFKFRGAYNAISQLSAKERARGILASSSGNHAQGVAEAAQLMGTKATIVMPHDAPFVKKHRTQRSGATIVEYDRVQENRDEVVKALLQENDAVFIHPFDNMDVMAGQGVIGLEIMDQLKEHNRTPDIITICQGGGGISAGISTAIKHLSPQTALYGAEPEDFDDTKRSFEQGERVKNDPQNHSICDAILVSPPGDMTFPINQQNLSAILTASDEMALKTMRILYEECKLIVEPGGCVSLAALLFHNNIPLKGKTIVATLTGGNVDKAMFDRALQTPL